MQTPQNQSGMSRDEIKAELIRMYGTMKAAAALIEEKPKLVSDTIARHVRNERIRLKLSTAIEKSYEATWGEKPRGKGKQAAEPRERSGVSHLGQRLTRARAPRQMSLEFMDEPAQMPVLETPDGLPARKPDVRASLSSIVGLMPGRRKVG